MKRKTALITGGSRGIGAAISRCFKKQGIRVLAPVREELDLLSDLSIDAYLDSLKGPIDILVNNAGINLIASITELNDEKMQNVLQVNLLAPIRIIRKLVPEMIQREYGRIINIGSMWGSITKPHRIAYTITKSGLNGLTRSLSVELAPHNILVNCVAPGYVNTELTKKNNSFKEIECIKKTIPLRRLSEPAEIAEVVAFLVSEKNSYITGQVIIVDGGFTCV